MISLGWPAPAKLNLFLHITGQRQDGYHLLQTVFQFIQLVDVIDFTILEKRFRELAFLNSNLKINITDNRSTEAKEVKLYYEGGIKSFVEYLDRSKTSIHENIIYLKGLKR